MKKILFVILTLCIVSMSGAQNRKKATPAFKLSTADSLFGLSLWQDAIPVYEGVLKTSPGTSITWNRVGFSYQSVGDMQKALSSYKTALENNPPASLKPIILSRMARAYAVSHDAEKAFQSLDQALEAGYRNAGELENHADFKNLRSDARLAKAITRATAAAMPCLTSEQSRQFDFWIGEWDVYPRGANLLVGQSHVEMASGGCMILENWTALGGVPNTGKSMNYVNAVTGKWEQLWVGSGGITINNPQKFVNGEYKDSAMRFEFEQSNLQGQKQIGRFIFFNEGADQVRQFNEVSTDNGTTWTTVYDFVYKRKKG